MHQKYEHLLFLKNCIFWSEGLKGWKFWFKRKQCLTPGMIWAWEVIFGIWQCTCIQIWMYVPIFAHSGVPSNSNIFSTFSLFSKTETEKVSLQELDWPRTEFGKNKDIIVWTTYLFNFRSHSRTVIKIAGGSYLALLCTVLPFGYVRCLTWTLRSKRTALVILQHI